MNEYTKRSLRSACTGNNIPIQVGDNILVQPEAGGDDYVACVEEIRAARGKPPMLRVRWYYRPEDVYGGRREFYGKHELLKSNHVDTIELETVKRTCRVVTLQEYMQFDKPIGADIYYARFSYSPAYQLIDGEAQKLCYCKTLFNPDMEMLLCRRCLRLYHLDCLHRYGEWDGKNESLESLRFVCSTCTPADDDASS